MKAVTLVATHELEVVDDWLEPECGPRDVIVEMHGVGLCGTDLASYDGKSVPARLPWVMGHEGGGTIVAVGSQVTDRQVGQKVVIEPNIACGHCAACRAGRTSVCDSKLGVGFAIPGLLAERVAIDADYTLVVDDDLPDVALACFEPLVVADTAVRRSGLPAGGEALVIGAGSVGQLVSQAIAAAGATPWIVDPHEGRLALAESLGARRAELGDGRQYPFVFETSGAAAVWGAAIGSVVKGGLLVLVGFIRDEVKLTPVDLVRRQITIRGHLTYDHPKDFAATLEAVRSGKLVAQQAVRAEYPAADAKAAFAAVREVPGKTWINFEEWRRAR
ncbi:MAG TPA: alcohol dehydrogenase catalytic domain-containing protein [Rugosimonospora sp.]|nr:alcohol dehydrogenase catalytic domain-containing protein [Rugosimonospora sp.]